MDKIAGQDVLHSAPLTVLGSISVIILLGCVFAVVRLAMMDLGVIKVSFAVRNVH